MNATLEKVTTAIAEKSGAVKRQALEAYFKLVRSIADNGEPDPAEAAEIMERAAMTNEDLCRDVEHAEKRNKLREDIAKLPKLQADLAKAEKAKQVSDAEFEAAKQKHISTVFPLENSIRELHHFIERANEARSELFRSCNDPSYREREARNGRELQAVAQQERKLRDAMSGTNRQYGEFILAERELSRQKQSGDAAAIAEAQKRYDAIHANIKAPIDAKLSKLAARRAELNAESAALAAEAINL